jgi:hypothetical protein
MRAAMTNARTIESVITNPAIRISRAARRRLVLSSSDGIPSSLLCGAEMSTAESHYGSANV